MHVHASRLVDAVAGTRAVSPSGLFHDEPDMPSMEEADAAFARSGLPAEGVDVLIAATKADAVIAGLGLTRPAMGQYRHAWRELAARPQARSGSTSHEGAGAKAFAEDARDDPALPEWRRKIRRRAVAVLVEVARTGTREWHPGREGPHAPTEGPGSLRADHVGSPGGRNLAATTVGPRDRVLGRMPGSSGASTPEDVASLGAEQVAAVVGGFSGARTTRGPPSAARSTASAAPGPARWAYRAW